MSRTKGSAKGLIQHIIGVRKDEQESIEGRIEHLEKEIERERESLETVEFEHQELLDLYEEQWGDE